MRFWESSEATGEATKKLTEICRLVEDLINQAFRTSTLETFDAEIRYIPIIMEEKFRARYPARSRLDRKNRVYACCPQLDHDAFVAAAPAERALIYLEGLRECGAGLAKLGATPAQVAEFDAILTEVGRRVAAQLGH
jgi:hypothetical protein